MHKVGSNRTNLVVSTSNSKGRKKTRRTSTLSRFCRQSTRKSKGRNIPIEGKSITREITEEFRDRWREKERLKRSSRRLHCALICAESEDRRKSYLIFAERGISSFNASNQSRRRNETKKRIEHHRNSVSKRATTRLTNKR